MLPQTAKAMVTSTYRTIANVRALYELFAYLVLGRIENTGTAPNLRNNMDFARLEALKHFFPAPFSAVGLSPGLLYWSVSGLSGLLKSGLGGGWDCWRGEVLRRAPGWRRAGFPPHWCGWSNLERASSPQRRAWLHGSARRPIGRWGLLLGMVAKGVGFVRLWLGPEAWQTWQLLHSIGPPFQFRAPLVGSDGSWCVPGNVRSFLLLASCNVARANRPARLRGCPSRVRGETRVMSIASCVPPHKVRPLAVTSMRRPSGRVECSMRKSVSRVLVVIRAPASRHILAVAPAHPGLGTAARWSP